MPRCAWTVTPKEGLTEYEQAQLCLACNRRRCREDGDTPLPPKILGRPADPLLKARNAQICERHRAGEKVYQLSIRFGLTEGTIRQILCHK